MPDFKFDLNVFTILLAILGWVYLRHNGHYFAKRSELKAYIKDTQEHLKFLERTARNYWSAELPEGGSRSKDCIDVMIGLTRLEHYLKQINKLGLEVDIPKTVSSVRQALTGNDFASVNKPALKPDDGKMLNISQSINKTFILLDSAFEERFSSPFPKFGFGILKKIICQNIL